MRQRSVPAQGGGNGDRRRPMGAATARPEALPLLANGWVANRGGLCGAADEASTPDSDGAAGLRQGTMGECKRRKAKNGRGSAAAALPSLMTADPGVP